MRAENIETGLGLGNGAILGEQDGLGLGFEGATITTALGGQGNTPHAMSLTL